MEQPAPRHIDENPSLPDGQYDALIRDIRLQRSSCETQILLLFYLPEQQMHLVTDIRDVVQAGYHGQSQPTQPDPEWDDLGALHGKMQTHSTTLSSVLRTCTLRIKVLQRHTVQACKLRHAACTGRMIQGIPVPPGESVTIKSA